MGLLIVFTANIRPSRAIDWLKAGHAEILWVGKFSDGGTQPENDPRKVD